LGGNFPDLEVADPTQTKQQKDYPTRHGSKKFELSPSLAWVGLRYLNCNKSLPFVKNVMYPFFKPVQFSAGKNQFFGF